MFKKLLALMLIASTLTGCASGPIEKEGKKYQDITTYTGEKIGVELNTSDGFNFRSFNTFYIYEDGKEVAKVELIDKEQHQELLKDSANSYHTTMVETGERDGATWTVYSQHDKVYFYLMEIPNLDSVAIVSSVISLEKLNEVFNRLTFQEHK